MQDIDLTEREQKEVEFALEYYEHFSHGTPGHTQLTIIAKLALQLELAKLISQVERQ